MNVLLLIYVLVNILFSLQTKKTQTNKKHIKQSKTKKTIPRSGDCLASKLEGDSYSHQRLKLLRQYRIS